MLKSLISKGLTVPHRCEKRYIISGSSVFVMQWTGVIRDVTLI
ncbi:hypothetical protein MiTe_00667 [Microcystis aeruginosa NIES-2520]|uniref:Uncharacterized protein n=1 Tax=Microcystis aeruginosa NIES-2520 TaxID=2303982 RepID=A0A5A5RL45_MICAE|nr:hypothetical protein MiTe_00667 [Microcystis aeruginosa NIES-2520]